MRLVTQIVSAVAFIVFGFDFLRYYGGTFWIVRRPG